MLDAQDHATVVPLRSLFLSFPSSDWLARKCFFFAGNMSHLVCLVMEESLSNCIGYSQAVVLDIKLNHQ